MEWVEAEGASKDKALSNAMEELGAASQDDIIFEELKVKRLFMGMGGRTVKIRARLKSDEERAVVDESVSEESPKSSSNDSGDSPYMAKLKAREEAEAAAPAENRDSGVVTMNSPFRPWEEDGEPGVVVPPRGRGFGSRLYSDIPPDPESKPKPRPKKGGGKKRGGPRKTEESFAREERIDTVQYNEDDFVPAVYEESAETVVSVEDRDIAVAFVTETIQKTGIEAEIVSWRLADRLLIQVNSDSGGLLIGRRGETIDSLQYLTELMLNKGRENRIRVVVDTELYRERRMDKMAFLATKAADDADNTKRSISLNPMNATERRIVHMTLAEDTRVHTVSEGAGPRRRVVVHPAGKKKGNSSGDRDGNRR